MRLILSGGFSLDNFGKIGRFFRAVMTELGKFRMGFYGRIGVYSRILRGRDCSHPAITWRLSPDDRARDTLSDERPIQITEMSLCLPL